MLYFVLVLATAFAVWEILRIYGVFETSKGVSQLTEDIRKSNSLRRKRAIEKQKLRLFEGVNYLFKPLGVSSVSREEHEYFIDRLELKSTILDRNLTPEELRGKYLLVFYCSLLFVPLCFFSLMYAVVPILGLVGLLGYKSVYLKKIEDEDLIIDTHFIDLYLLMYSRLRMGSRARLHSVVESYIESLNVISEVEVKRVMQKLARTLLNNLLLYEDHTAVRKLRERYRSAIIVNFCNVAAQAMQGIDNADTLLTLKMDLVNRKLELSRKRALKLQARAQRSISLIYVILFLFIAIGWYSKLPTGFF